MLTALNYAAMVGAFVAMLYYLRQFRSRGHCWARPLAGFCGILSVLLAALAVVRQYPPFQDGRATGAAGAAEIPAPASLQPGAVGATLSVAPSPAPRADTPSPAPEPDSP